METLQAQFNTISFARILKKWDSPFYYKIMEAFCNLKGVLENRIPVIFPSYTLHNIEHSIRVANYMYDLTKDRIDPENKSKSAVKELDIVIMLYAAILHDVGMAVGQPELEQIINDHHPVGKDDSSAQYRFQLSGVKNLGVVGDDELIGEFVRRTHAFRSRLYVEAMEESCFSVMGFGTGFQSDVALVCQSHNEDFDWIEKFLPSHTEKGSYSYNPQFCACMLRLADLMDIDARRTPEKLYEMIAPAVRSNMEWKQHFVIENANKVHQTSDGKLQLKFLGHCKDADIHRKIYGYIDWIQQEVVGTIRLMKTFHPEYILPLEPKPLREIKGEGYEVPDYKMGVDFKAITTLLMGEKIYGRREMGLRELLQNSMDACRLRAEIEKKNYRTGDPEYRPCIHIIYEEDKVRIKDNGTGMTEEILKHHFLTIGRSYYQSDQFKLNNYTYSPIGTFGIGFLACFMLSKHVHVKTRHMDSSLCLELELKQGEEYFSIKRTEEHRFGGTEIILDRKEFEEIFPTGESAGTFILEQIITDEIEFIVTTEEEQLLVSSDLQQLMDLELSKDNQPEERAVLDITTYGKCKYITGYFVLWKKPFIFKIFGNLFQALNNSLCDENVFFYNGEKILGNNQVLTMSIAPLVKSPKFEFLHIRNKVPTDESRRYNSVKILYDNNKPVSLAEIEEIALKDLQIQKYLGTTSGEKIETELKFTLLHTTIGSEYVIPFGGENIVSQYSKYEENEDYDSFRWFESIGTKYGELYNKGVSISYDKYTGYEMNINSYLTITGVFNLTYPFIETNVERSYINENSSVEFEYALNRFAHKAALKELTLSPGEKKVLESFIETYYKEPSVFEG